jgi:hypothetical protein
MNDPDPDEEMASAWEVTIASVLLMAGAVLLGWIMA